MSPKSRNNDDGEKRDESYNGHNQKNKNNEIGELVRLGQLEKGCKGVIEALNRYGEYSESFIRRLLEMGLLEGTTVEIVHEGPFGGDPLALKVRGSLLALRRHEANAVEVRIVRSEKGFHHAESRD